MKSIRLENLRSLNDTGDIKVEGLTIIVGENSIGKSTIVRSLPLLKQSIETKTTTPFLWFGEYTDFGSFKNSLNKKSKDGRIVFDFKFRIPRVAGIRMRYIYDDKLFSDDVKHEDIELALYVKGEAKIDYIDEINMKILDNIIQIKISKAGKVINANINEQDVTEFMKDYIFLNSAIGIIPELYIKENNRLYPYYYNRKDGSFYEKLVGLIKESVRKNTKKDRIEQIINSFKITYKNKFENDLLTNRSKIALASWNDFLNDSTNIDEINIIHNIFIGYLLPMILESSSDYLNNFLKNIYYIAPLRANAQRYYRNQNLAVDSVDFQGMNLPMILANLSPHEKERFSEWVNDNFGFGVSIEMSEGHISLNIKRGDELDNMVDCGFGYSQLLPIITQIWLMINKRRVRQRRFDDDSNNVTLIIEQPELHLHPKMQGKLVDIFAKCIGVEEKKINIIIETHSETIINRIGDLISENHLSREETNLYVLSRRGEKVVVEEGKYDVDGILENWPIDFFNVED